MLWPCSFLSTAQCNEEKKVTNIRTQIHFFSPPLISSSLSLWLYLAHTFCKRNKKRTTEKKNLFFPFCLRIGRCCVLSCTFFLRFYAKVCNQFPSLRAAFFLSTRLSLYFSAFKFGLWCKANCNRLYIGIKLGQKKATLKVFLCCRFLFHWLFRSVYTFYRLLAHAHTALKISIIDWFAWAKKGTFSLFRCLLCVPFGVFTMKGAQKKCYRAFSLFHLCLHWRWHILHIRNCCCCCSPWIILFPC